MTFSASHHVLAYRAAFFGSLVTCQYTHLQSFSTSKTDPRLDAIVIYKTYIGTRAPPKIDVQLAARVWADENVQYFLLAVYWGVAAQPVSLALVPYIVFSVFHCLTYLRTAVLPTFDPSSTSETSQTTYARLARASGAWVKSNYEKAMQLVAGVEVVLLGLRLTLGLVFRQSSFVTLIVFAAFLRYRYLTSAFVRQRFSAVALAVDHTLADPRVPPAAKGAWKTACETIYKTLGTRRGPETPAPTRKST